MSSTSASASFSSPAPSTSASTSASASTVSSSAFNGALFLSSLTGNKPVQPFTFRRSFLSSPLSKRATDAGSDEKDKSSVEGEVDVLRFGRHHPRRAELQGEWEEELIAQLQREEEDREGEKKQKQIEEDDAAGKAEKSPAARAESSSSSAAVATASASADPSASSSSSSPSFSTPPSTPATPLSAADATLSSVLHLLAADKQPTLPQRICNLLTAAIAYHATLMQQFTSHVLQPQQQSDDSMQLSASHTPFSAVPTVSSSPSADDKLVVAKQDELLSTLPQFAAKHSVELTDSLDSLKEAEALLAEWKKDTSLSASDLTACDSLLSHVLHPLSATFTSLLSPNPSLSSVASPSSLVASFLLAKRGRGRLHKCDKHRRWKKKCPPDCPDKPQGKWDDSAPMDDDSDEDDDEDDEEAEADKGRKTEQPARPAPEPSTPVGDKKRKLDGHDKSEPSSARAQSATKRAHEVVKAVHAFQPVATATAIAPSAATATAASPPTALSPFAASPSPSREEVVRAREAALAAQVIPSAVQLSAASPMPHAVQVMAHPVARPASLPSTQQTLYAAQPLVLQSAMPARAGLPSNTLYAFAPANQLTPSLSSASFSREAQHTTLYSLEQLTAMHAQQQPQPGNTYRLVPVQTSGVQLPHTPTHQQVHTATAFAQPYIPPHQMSVVYTANPNGSGGVTLTQAGATQQYTFPSGAFQLQQQSQQQ